MNRLAIGEQLQPQVGHVGPRHLWKATEVLLSGIDVTRSENVTLHTLQVLVSRTDLRWGAREHRDVVPELDG